eukprot:1110258-Heterocapsa_arctica.AAC.1
MITTTTTTTITTMLTDFLEYKYGEQNWDCVEEKDKKNPLDQGALGHGRLRPEPALRVQLADAELRRA